jgi:hypothetical protein
MRAVGLKHPLVSFRNYALQVNGTADGFDGTGKFDKQSVPRGFEDAAPMASHRGPDDISQELL